MIVVAWKQISVCFYPLQFVCSELSCVMCSMISELAFAFVYREVLRSTPSTEGVAAKRKAGIVSTKATLIVLFLICKSFTQQAKSFLHLDYKDIGLFQKEKKVL